MTDQPPLLQALVGHRPPTVPVWFMRQAGRSLPEYRRARAGVPMLDACLDPALAAELTLQPVRRHGVDAAVLFSDIVVPLRLAGVDVSIVPGRGPLLEHPVSTAADVDALRPLEPERLAPVRRAAELTVAELGHVPLIGFAAAPFTLASYMVAGGPSKDQLPARRMMTAEPELFARVMRRAAEYSAAFLRAQIDGGAAAVQLFDSWAGMLSRRQYREQVMPHSAAVIASVAGTVPVIHFGLVGRDLLPLLARAGADAVGVDFRTSLGDAIDTLGGAVPVQGNLDPAVLAAEWPVVADAVHAVLTSGLAAPAHVFNLGHGVPPDTDPDVLTRVVELVHEWRPEDVR